MYRRPIAVALALALACASVPAAPKLELTSDDTVVVQADEAWEEPRQQIAHFRGNFQLRAPDWSVVADSAIVYGPLEDPQRVVVEGLPARIRLLKSDRVTRIEGQGQKIEYQRATDSLTLSGQARFKDGENTLASSLIEYDLEAERITAGGPEGVEIIVPPKKD